ncbi:uncharacterized protein [Prorops nasuta]|uniref:uncharacterized protein n=1 Tax=Prorops nasuta TaxID=863751 RepID=UPI0034CDE81E
MSRTLPKRNEHPYMAAIMAYGSYHCNGVIISTKIVLATAACVLDKKNELQHITIQTGSKYLWKGQIHQVKKYYVYEINTNEIDPGVLYPIGAFKLKTPMKINSAQSPINIASLPEGLYDKPTITRLFRMDWHGTLSGYGKRQLESGTNLKRTTIVIERIPFCKESLTLAGLSYYDHNICGYENEVYIGNDGSVLVYNNSLIGLATYTGYTLFTVSGAAKIGTVFTYIYKVKPFIDLLLLNS